MVHIVNRRLYNSDENGIGRLASWMMKKSAPVVFLFLSIKFDAFITTAYLRHGQYNGMTKRDRTIFMGSLLISNIYWTLAVYMGITIVELVCNAIVRCSI